MRNASDNERRTSKSRLLEHHRDHAAAQVRAHARDLGGDVLVVEAEAPPALGDRPQVAGRGRLEADVAGHCARRAARARTARMVPLQRLTHVGICVSDMDRSLRFYRDCLGFRHEHELRVAGEPSDTLLRLRGVDLHAVYLARDGVRVELLAFASPSAPPPRPRAMNEHGLTHLSFRVTDLDVTLAALRAAGERVLEETVIRFPAYQSAACFIVDPDGQLIELVQAPGDPAAPPRAG